MKRLPNWFYKEEDYIRDQIIEAFNNDVNVEKFTRGNNNKCPICKKAWCFVGYTFLMGMVTGLSFGCKGHRQRPTGMGVMLQGREKYFTGVLFSA